MLTLGELAEKLETTGVEVIKELMKLGMMATINQQIDYATAARVATALGWETNEEESELAGQGDDFETRRIEAESDPEAKARAVEPVAHRGDRKPRLAISFQPHEGDAAAPEKDAMRAELVNPVHLRKNDLAR